MIKPVTVVILLCISFAVSAQTTPSEITSAENSQTFAIDYFNKTIGQQAELYNGPEYISLPGASRGSPYLHDKDTFIKGTIKYNGTWYSNVPLLYDIYKSKIASIHPVNNYRFIFHDYLLSDFIIAGEHFIYINEPDSVKQQLKPGYYELLYNGKSTVLLRRTKERTETTSVQGIEVVFEDRLNYYVMKGNVVYNVSGKGSVLNVFKDKKKELNTYLSKNNINFNDNKSLAISKLAAYYDQISQ